MKVTFEIRNANEFTDKEQYKRLKDEFRSFVSGYILAASCSTDDGGEITPIMNGKHLNGVVLDFQPARQYPTRARGLYEYFYSESQFDKFCYITYHKEE